MRCSHLPSTAEEQPVALKANVTALPILAAPHEVHVRITSFRSRSAQILKMLADHLNLASTTDLALQEVFCKPVRSTRCSKAFLRSKQRGHLARCHPKFHILKSGGSICIWFCSHAGGNLLATPLPPVHARELVPKLPLSCIGAQCFSPKRTILARTFVMTSGSFLPLPLPAHAFLRDDPHEMFLVLLAGEVKFTRNKLTSIIFSRDVHLS